MASESAQDLLALVMVGGRYFVGEVMDEQRAATLPGEIITLRNVINIDIITIPVRAPNGQTAFHKEITAEPFLFSWEGSPILIRPEVISLFSTMEEGDRKRYKKLVADAERLVKQLRAQDAGLVLPAI